jgi:hypothetical protein
MTDDREKDLPERVLSRLKNWRPIAYLIVLGVALGGIASFSDSISRIYMMAVGALKEGATPVILPKDTGWIFAGYFDEGLNKYTQGPYFKTVRSPYPTKSQIPRQGEWLRITSDRNIIIADFETKGLTRRFDPPWQQNELKDSDYTGLKLPSGAVVEVRDVSLGAFVGRPAAVWVRVGVAR